MPTVERRFNPPPGWPPPPPDWVPPPGWTPPREWPPAPPYWNFWVVVEHAPVPRTPRPARLVAARVVLAVLAAFCLLLGISGWTAPLIGVGILLLAVGGIGTLRGHVRSAWLRGRPAGLAALVVGLAMIVTGAAIAPTVPAPPADASGTAAAASPTPNPTHDPTAKPTDEPTTRQTANPTREPTPSPTPKTSSVPTVKPTDESTPKQSAKPTRKPTPKPTRKPRPTHEPKPEPTHKPKPEPTHKPPPPGTAGTALAAAALLTVKGRAPMTGYDRTRYGTAWADVDHNGCDTRNDILRRDLDPVTVEAGTDGCLVLAGVLHDPYTGTTIHFTRGVETSWHVQIDHVVALGDSWQKGAQQWSAHKRERFANDPLNLLAVDGPTNDSKGDGDTATWLPPNKAERCPYVARQVAVKKAYGLWVTAAEQAAMERVLRTCPNQQLPTEASSRHRKAATAHVESAPEPTREPTPKKTAKPAPAPNGGALDPRYDTCKEAIEHGYGPYRRGVDPEYQWYRDADDDGVVCER